MTTSSCEKLYKNIILAVLLTLLSGNASVASDNADEVLPRIVGGESVSIQLAPSTVALLSASAYERTNSMRAAQFCGGTLISDTWVLTAAHCLVDKDNRTVPVSSVLVVAGTTDLDNPDTDPIAIDSLVMHPSFANVNTGSDIALLRLVSPTNSPAASLDTNPIAFNDRALIAGWGTLKSQGVDEQPELTPLLQAAVVFMVPGNVCDDTFPDNQGATGHPVTGSQICAAVNGGGIDSCQGDSGGPLYRVGENDELSLVGVVSFGVGCALSGYPGIYTNIASFRSFVTTTLNDNPTVNTTTQISSDDPDEDEIVLPPLPGAGSGFLVLPLLCLAWCWRIRRSLG